MPMGATKKQRPAWDEYYLNIAEQVALRSTCLRRNFGAVIVNHDQIIATGYGGAPRNTKNCCDVGFCYRRELGARRGEHYEFCRAVHAEQNAIIHAPRLQMLGGVLYLVGLDAKTKEPLEETEPCRICKRMIANAGIESVVTLCGQGRTKKFSIEKWKKNNFWELRKKGKKFVPVRPPRLLSDPADEERASRLISRFSLNEAVVVQGVSYEEAKFAVARVAARFFVSKVATGSSVALSCGDTLLSMIQWLPEQPRLKLTIHQLSIEGDPAMIHQAPATLVGLLRSKCSPKSYVYGLQLPPLRLAASSLQLRQELVGTEFFRELKKEARSSDYVFLGLGSARRDSASFWAMAQAATDGKFPLFVKKLGIVGEMNNQPFDRSGKDCSDRIPGFEKHVINVLTLEDIRRMVSKPAKHKVVMVATGRTKTEGIRVALETGLANVLMTSKADADRLLSRGTLLK